MTIINKSVHSEISRVYYGISMNNRYMIAVFIKTKVIFALILLKGKFTERTFENLKFNKILFKVKYLKSFQI